MRKHVHLLFKYEKKDVHVCKCAYFLDGIGSAGGCRVQRPLPRPGSDGASAVGNRQRGPIMAKTQGPWRSSGKCFKMCKTVQISATTHILPQKNEHQKRL